MNAITSTEREVSIHGVKGRAFAVVSASDGRILNQTMKARRTFTEDRHEYSLTVELRFDDNCNNGHETFAITGDLRRDGREYAGGCLHDDIAKHFPELAGLIKWHLTSTDGPMHYTANTLYWLGLTGYADGKAGSPPNMEHARSCAVWPEMPEGMTKAEASRLLDARLPALLDAFKAYMIAAGFVYPSPRVAKAA